MDKEHEAIERIKLASKMSLKLYKKLLVVTTSGGKDSSVVVALAQKSGIPFEVMHNHTTADAPETVYFVQQEFKRLEVDGIKCITSKPIYKGKLTSMWGLIPLKLMPPTRLVRYCCEILKEHGGSGRFITTGVRWAESKRRKDTRGVYEIPGKTASKAIILNNDNDKKRQLFETCNLKAKRVCNPIIDWTDRDVWDYIDSEHIKVNPLYSCGFSRVGCIGCPMAGKSGRNKQFFRYPTFKKNYIFAFDRMQEERKRKGLKLYFENGEDVFHWWMEDGVLPGQFSIEGMDEDDT